MLQAPKDSIHDKEEDADNEIASPDKLLGVVPAEQPRLLGRKRTLGRTPVPITEDLLDRFRQAFESDPVAQRTSAATIKLGVKKAMMLPMRDSLAQHEFSNVIKHEGPINDQMSTGRCWIFAGLNMLTPRCMQELRVKELKLSARHLFFYDKLERSSLFFDTILETADLSLQTQRVQDLLNSPNGSSDGGHWTWFKNLVNKYGVMPEGIMPKSKSTESSTMLNRHIGRYLRAGARQLREMNRHGADRVALLAKKTELLQGVSKMLATHLGFPPKTFDWQYRDKDGELVTLRQCTSQSFAKDVLKINVNDYVHLLFYPLDEYPDYQPYEITNATSGNVAEGMRRSFLKVPLGDVKACVANSIRNNDPAIISAAMRDHDGGEGLMDLRHFDVESFYGLDFDMTTAQRVRYLGHHTTHQMIITGFHQPYATGPIEKWRIQNSWGKDVGEKGYYVATDAWFDENAFKVVVHKDALSPKLQQAMLMKPNVLDAQQLGHGVLSDPKLPTPGRD